MGLIKVFRILLFCLSIILTMVAGFVFVKRLLLPYNSEGNYFDAVKGINYHQQAVFIYGFLFAICVAISIGLFFSIVRKSSIKEVFRITVKKTNNEI